jgi:hypothetical protein
MEKLEADRRAAMEVSEQKALAGCRKMGFGSALDRAVGEITRMDCGKPDWTRFCRLFCGVNFNSGQRL